MQWAWCCFVVTVFVHKDTCLLVVSYSVSTDCNDRGGPRYYESEEAVVQVASDLLLSRMFCFVVVLHVDSSLPAMRQVVASAKC